VLLAVPFLKENAIGYISRAFELTRQFLFKWTVNWRFLGEEAFLSRRFSIALVAVHLSLLVLFVSSCWLRPSGLNPLQFAKKFVAGQHLRVKLSDRFVMTTLLASMTVGLLCARTLHYQFFAYLSWSTPYLLWEAGFHPVLIYAIWAVQEWAWNVYPSTDGSSITIVVCLAIQVVGAIFAQNRGVDGGPIDTSKKIPSKKE
jgi:alpha-1,3-mannosyltransferase